MKQTIASPQTPRMAKKCLSHLLFKTHNNNETDQTYIHEQNSFAPLAIVDQANNISYYHNDHLGTPRELTDEQGQIIWEAQYKTWGSIAKEQYNQKESKIVQSFRFQGQYYDSETGLHYNRFRYYDADVGRFISLDPIGLFAGTNLYQYAPNPTGWVDPFGLAKIACDCDGDGISDIEIDDNNPNEFKDLALKRQGLDPENPPASFKEKMKDEETGIKYEVRAHPANESHGKTDSIYRVQRQRPGVDENGQGFGKEYLDSNGVWHPQKTLKPGPNQNVEAATNTHIQL